MVRDPAAAEDVAQEAFVKAFRSLASYDAGQRFSSWMFKIAHNTAVDLLRRKPLDTVPLEGGAEEDAAGPIAVLADDRSASPEGETLRGDLRRALERGLASLRRDYRTVLVLRFHEGLAYEEIAEVTGLPLGTVKTHIHRGRKELAAFMTRLGFGETGGGGDS